jgi:hypothetical protein
MICQRESGLLILLEPVKTLMKQLLFCSKVGSNEDVIICACQNVETWRWSFYNFCSPVWTRRRLL